MASLAITGFFSQNDMAQSNNPYQFGGDAATSWEESIVATPIIGVKYLMTYTISNLTTGSVGVSMFLVGNNSTKFDEIRSANGTYTIEKLYSSALPRICFNEQSYSPFTIITVDSIVSISLPPQPEVFENCCTNQTNIVWLNREGGFQNYIFSGVKTIEVSGGDAKTFKRNGIIKYYQRENIYDGKIVTTSNIPRNHVDYLDSLRHSIQAWEWNQADSTFREILIDIEDYVKYTTRQKLFDVAIRFIYADEILIQTQ